MLYGGLYAIAMPRGSGKTSLCECACMWATLYGHQEFVALIGSDEGHAMQLLDSIKTELECNDLLFEDFPEACYPIRRLEGIAHRCNGQLHLGKRTHITWSANEVVLPAIPGSKAGGAIMVTKGLTGGVRGMKFKRTDGKSVRPSLVIVDDAQTDDSARSVTQCETRERILAGAILGLAGPGRKIAGVLPCTVIRPGDLADNILDRQKHPEWNGERTQMVYSFPTNEKLWEKYAEIRAEELRAGRGIVAATEFYVAHRVEMDAGAKVAWDARFNPDEASAIQHAMNLRLQDERAFWAEYQNKPMPETLLEEATLTADEIAAKLNKIARREVPGDAQHVTAFVDVQKDVLFYVVTAWADDFTGYVLDYGTFPDQARTYFSLRDVKRTLAKEFPKADGLEALLYAGLEVLVERLLETEWERDDGAHMRISKMLIDANWGASTDVVYKFARQYAKGAAVQASHGRYVGAASVPFAEYKKKKGDRVGHNWRVPSVVGQRAVTHVLFDANFWKSFVHTRFSVGLGGSGSLSLWGAKPEIHRMIAEHCTAEFKVKTEGRGRTVDEWKLRPGRSDNHFFDCLVGASVAASMVGVTLPKVQTETKPTRPKKKVSFAEMQAARRARD